MKKILITLGLFALAGCALFIYLGFKIRDKVLKAEGQAVYSADGAWLRIQEYAHAGGKKNYINEADQKLKFLENEIASWRERAEAAGIDIASFEKFRNDAYETTDRNIKNGQNPLSYLDQP